MKISEIVTTSGKWQEERGIVNPNDGLDRTQVELDEAKAETDPVKRLIECVDTIIILAGGMYGLCEQIGVDPTEVEEMFAWKFGVNSAKYPLEQFENHSVETAITRCRFYWDHPEQFPPSDVY